jgi:predicted TIM-barrel fold metal-dependent hydrolase
MRVDCHIHIDRIGAPHTTPPPTPEETLAYARREEIGLLAAIYEDDSTLARFRAVGLTLFPFFWVRTPRSARVPETARGIKLHPYIERYPFTIENILPALLIARERQLPLLVHSDDREPDLSRGRLFENVARAFPDLVFIMAHSGSYAPGPADKPGTTYVAEELVRELVLEAISVANKLPNVYLETSVLASRLKAELLARHAPHHKLLIGSDFPICKGSFGSVVHQERQLVDAGMPEDFIRQIHENAAKLLNQRPGDLV